MRIGLNDGDHQHYSSQVPGRDMFEFLLGHPTESFQLLDEAANSAHYYGFVPHGCAFPDYAHWGETYNPAQAYPSSSDPNDDNYLVCVKDGLNWQRTNHTPQTGVAPDPADGAGIVSGWRRYGLADPSVVAMNAMGMPTKHPDDPHLKLKYYLPWSAYPVSRYPFTLHCKTEPGANHIIHNNGTDIVMSNQNLGAGTFDLTFNRDNSSVYMTIDRATAISSAFFIAGVPDFETGTVAQDIGTPYVQVDKLSDFTGFFAMRNMTAARINRQNPRCLGVMNGLTASNGVPAGGVRMWKTNVDMANRGGHKAIWVNVDDIADSTYIDAMAAYYLANLNSNIEVCLELSNERWNSTFGQAAELYARAQAAGIDAIQLHARESKAMIGRWKTVWGGSASRVKGVFAWQAVSATVNYEQALEFESAYTMIDRIAIANYFESTNLTSGTGQTAVGYSDTPTNIRNAVQANAQSTWNTLTDALMRQAADYTISLAKSFYDWLPAYLTSKGRDPASILMCTYEGGPQLFVNQGIWDAAYGAGTGARLVSWVQAYKRGPLMAATYAYFLDRMASQCPQPFMAFDYQGPAELWGHMDRMGHPEQQPFATLKTKALAYNA